MFQVKSVASTPQKLPSTTHFPLLCHCSETTIPISSVMNAAISSFSPRRLFGMSEGGTGRTCDLSVQLLLMMLLPSLLLKGLTYISSSWKQTNVLTRSVKTLSSSSCACQLVAAAAISRRTADECAENFLRKYREKLSWLQSIWHSPF